MVKSVTTIPARINKKTAMPIDSPRKRRVAAYARVSTDGEEQATSYAAQVDYYTNYTKAEKTGSLSKSMRMKALQEQIPRTVLNLRRWSMMLWTGNLTSSSQNRSAVLQEIQSIP